VVLVYALYIGAVVFSDGAFSTSVPVKPLTKGRHHLPAVQLLRQLTGTSTVCFNLSASSLLL